MRAYLMALSLAVATPAMAGDMLIHDAIDVGDGGTRLVTCTNAKGSFLLYEPIQPAEAYVIRTDIVDAALSDVLAQILPNGWNVRYSTPAVEHDVVNLKVGTYWADALKVLAHDYNFMVVVDGAKRQVVLGRL